MASIKQFNFFKQDSLYNNVSLAEVAGISASVWILPVDCISDGFLELMRGSRFWKDRSLVWHRLSNLISSTGIASTITSVWQKWLAFLFQFGFFLWIAWAMASWNWYSARSIIHLLRKSWWPVCYIDDDICPEFLIIMRKNFL